MKAIQLFATGDPSKNLKLIEVPAPTSPLSGEVVIRMEYSPINFSDLMVARGVYFIQPRLPAVIGGEGVGVVHEVGADVNNVKVGDRVLIPFGTYAWAEFVKAPSRDLFAISSTSDVKQAAMAAINPPTAVLLLDEFVSLQENDWVVLNAGNSAVANTIISVAKSRKLKTVALVRRADAVETARKAGADLILIEGPDAAEAIKNATEGANIKLGLDAIGGESAALLARILGEDSHLVTYAVLSGQPMIVSQVDLIAKRITVHGFWMYQAKYLPKLNQALRESAALIAAKDLSVPIAAIYKLTAIDEAVAHAMKGGKVLIGFSA